MADDDDVGDLRLTNKNMVDKDDITKMVDGDFVGGPDLMPAKDGLQVQTDLVSRRGSGRNLDATLPPPQLVRQMKTRPALVPGAYRVAGPGARSLDGSEAPTIVVGNDPPVETVDCLPMLEADLVDAPQTALVLGTIGEVPPRMLPPRARIIDDNNDDIEGDADENASMSEEDEKPNNWQEEHRLNTMKWVKRVIPFALVLGLAIGPAARFAHRHEKDLKATTSHVIFPEVILVDSYSEAPTVSPLKAPTVSLSDASHGVATGIPNPVVELGEIEEGETLIYYWLNIVNYAFFPTELFAATGDSCPSRTWITIINNDTNTHIYGFCSLSSAPRSIWFTEIASATGPWNVRVDFWDRKEQVTYSSNVVQVSKPSP